ncbi:Ribonuclease H-like domain protein [Raphanus sativus]|nr:Ribonuclease H-like domain protein [Raphanus sativus]
MKKSEVKRFEEEKHKEKTTTNQRSNEDPSSHLEDFVGADLAGVNIQTVVGDHVGKEKTTTNQRLNEDPSSHLEDFVGADLAGVNIQTVGGDHVGKEKTTTNQRLNEDPSSHLEDFVGADLAGVNIQTVGGDHVGKEKTTTNQRLNEDPSSHLEDFVGADLAERSEETEVEVKQRSEEEKRMIPGRPDYGYIGERTTIRSNHFQVTIDSTNTGLSELATFINNSGHEENHTVKKTLRMLRNLLKKTARERFKLAKRGSEVRFVDFFRKQYKRKVTYLHLPAIQIGAGEYVPMEFCRIASGQPYTQRLSEQAFRLSREQAKNFRSASVITPGRRESMIQTMIRIDKEQALKLVNKKISVSDDLTSIEARVLPPPTKMINGASVTRWTCVNFSTLSPISATKFCQELTKMCRDLGMHIQHITQIISYDPEKIEDALREIHKKTADLQLLIVILPDMTGSYGKIKKICETELGIVSQCIRPGTILERPHLFLPSLALKINIKAGGKNYVLDKHISMVQDTPTIIFGADVTHPTKAEQSSLAAVVASMDWPEISTYRALVSAQTGRREIIEDLYKLDGQGEHTGMIRDHLLAFIRKTNQRPGRLIFFRDGVGETQFGDVLRFELQAIRKACSSIEDFRPKITFVLVQKRHHTRLFPAQADKKDAATGNVLPGTVVDTVICHPRQFDFFLNSHAGVMGTNRSTHYHVLLDENKFSADDLQRLTNDLCYTFAKTTNSVSLVTPVFYAHLAAFRARYYVEDEMSAVHLPTVKDEVKEKMYFC